VSAPAGLLVSPTCSGRPDRYLLVRGLGRGDVRTVGSGNVGATNTLRAAGWRAGLAVLLIDVAKGALAVVAMRQVTDAPVWVAAAGFAAVVGHCFPVWLSFSGGKGVATAVGAFAVVAPAALAIAAAVWLAVMVASRYVALASVTRRSRCRSWCSCWCARRGRRWAWPQRPWRW
jgi:glycerol-3-phosphate acyltransferase PlsY